MSVSEIPQPRPTDQPNRHLKSVPDLPSGDQEAVLLTPKEFKSTVIEIDWANKPTEYSVGSFTTGMAYMTDGSAMEVKVGEPIERTTDIAMATGTALFTRLRGLNKRMMLRTMGLGIPVVGVGTELEFDELPTIGRSAHNNLEILKVTEKKFGHTPGVNADYGISRRSMIALAMQAMVGMRERRLVTTDAIVPCFNGGLWEASLEELVKFATEPVTGIRKTANGLRNLSRNHMWLYLKTIDLTPRGIRSSAATIPGLVSGDTGTYGRLTDPATINMHIQAWRGDSWSQGESWQSDFSEYPNVVVDLIDEGSHFECATQETLDDWYARTTMLRDELVANDDDFTKVDVHKIIKAKASISGLV